MLLRLPGFGGGLITLASPEPKSDREPSARRESWDCTIELIDPREREEVGGRILARTELGRLAKYLRDVVTADFPELSVNTLALPGPGLLWSVVACDSMRLTIELTVLGRSGADDTGIQIETTRLATLLMAQDVAAELDASTDPPATGGES